MTSIIQEITIDAQKVLAIVDTLLPFAEKYIPALATVGGPIGLGVNLASSLLPLIGLIPVGTVITAAQQQDYLNRVQALVLLDFSGPQWQQSTAPAAATKLI